VSLTSELKSSSKADKLSITFYLASGIAFLALLPLSGLAPHLALIGILSLATAATVLVKKSWALWFVSVLFVTATVFSLWTIFAIGTSSPLVTAGLAAYFVLALITAAYLGLWRKPSLSS